MRLLIVIVAFCLYGVALWSQEVTSSHYVIEVNQRFNSSNHCDGGYPSLSKATFTIYKDDSALIKEECEGVRHSDSHFTAKTSFNLDKDSFNTFTSIEFYDETRGIGRKGNTFTDSKTIQKSDLHVGENIITPNCEGSAKCSSQYTEGYTIRTSIIIDNPVEIIPKKDNSSLCIDNGDKCEFSLNDFYVTKDTEFKLSIKLTSEDDNCWREVERKFKPKQEIAFSYDEIRSIAGITDPFAWSGKNISIKITKKLIDGSWTESNVVLCTFIHKGPDFEIETVRRTNCSDKVELIVKSERLGTYPEDKFKWAVSGGIGGNVKFKKSISPNTYKLSYEEDDFVSTYLREQPNELKSWFLQLQDIYEDGDSSVAYFTTKQFEIAPRAPQITISQYTDAGTEVESGLDPYIRIKIEDLDTYYDNGRVPYKVYEVDENGNEYYLTEFNNRIDATEFNEEELKNKFNSDNPDYLLDITEGIYKQNKL